MAPVPSRRVCVYCASSSHDQELLDIATEVGAEIARRGWSLVSGGGNVSLMGAVAEAARAGGARTVGVIPEGLRVREVADTSADELIVVTSMRERKREMEAQEREQLALENRRRRALGQEPLDDWVDARDEAETPGTQDEEEQPIDRAQVIEGAQILLDYALLSRGR